MKTISGQFRGFFFLTSGISADAERISTSIDEIHQDLYETVTSENPRSDISTQLDEYWAACSRDGWDGYGAKPINAMSYCYAHRFLLALPPQIPNPEPGVDPDGEVSFEWYKDLNHAFSISIAPNGDLSYAGIFGRNKVHGIESFEYDLPRPILSNLKRFLTGQ